MPVCQTAVYLLIGLYFVFAMLGLTLSITNYRHNIFTFIIVNLLFHLLIIVNVKWILSYLLRFC